MKYCSKCEETKPVSEFYRHEQMADGFLGICKACIRLYQKIKRRVDGDGMRARDRERAKRPGRRRAGQNNTARWRKRNPEKYQAQTAVGNALRDGKLEKEPCYFCEAKMVHAHHEDYSQPLDVTWLCAKCHHRFHALRKAS